jgi:uncharacterized protein (DUF2141 family)
MHRLALLAAVFATVAVSAQEPSPLATHDPLCTGHEGPRAIVEVTGFKDRTGQLRVELYPATAGDFLAPGRKLIAEGKTFVRIDIPMPQDGDASVCMPLPELGNYAMAILHDRNASGRLDPFSDGYGFPNNPRLGYKKPNVSVATIAAETPVTEILVRLNYWNGFSARPISSGEE